MGISLHWRHNEHDGISNYQPHDCLRITHPFIQVQIKETSKLRITGLRVRKSPVTGKFPAQKATYAENIPFDDVISIFPHFIYPLKHIGDHF